MSCRFADGSRAAGRSSSRRTDSCTTPGGGANGDDDVMTLMVAPLDPEVPHNLGINEVVACCDGSYQLDFNLSHSLPFDVP